MHKCKLYDSREIVIGWTYRIDGEVVIEDLQGKIRKVDPQVTARQATRILLSSTHVV